MSLTLRIALFIVGLLMLVSTTTMVKKNEIPIRYSLWWFLSSIVLIVVSLFPAFISMITSFVGFQVSSNLVIGIFITFLIIITQMLTKVVSEQSKKITSLIQEISMLKKEKDDEK